MGCPKCFWTRHCKNGKVKGRQRYKCSRCGHNYTLLRKKWAPHYLKFGAVYLYYRGRKACHLAEYAQVSLKTMYRWIHEANAHSPWFVAAFTESNHIKVFRSDNQKDVLSMQGMEVYSQIIGHNIEDDFLELFIDFSTFACSDIFNPWKYSHHPRDMLIINSKLTEDMIKLNDVKLSIHYDKKFAKEINNDEREERRKKRTL